MNRTIFVLKKSITKRIKKLISSSVKYRIESNQKAHTPQPSSESFSLTTPHGAIPIAIRLCLEFGRISFNMSPICLTTPFKQKRILITQICDRPYRCVNTCVSARCYDPNMRSVDHLDQATLQCLFKLGLQAKIGYTTMDRYYQFGQLQLPIILQQFYYILRL